MTKLTPEEYVEAIRTQSERFGAVLAACDPAACVPGCPDWDAGDLLQHLTEVQWHWASVVVDRPREADETTRPSRPSTYAEQLTLFGEWSAGLVAALEGVDPAEEAWTWSEDHTVGFILRRQAHEALIHRLDAEQTAGQVTDLPPELAADGVREVLEVMYGGSPSWGSFTPDGGLARLDSTDTGDVTWVRLGTFAGTDPTSGTTYADEPDLAVVEPPEDDTEPDVVIDGPAGALDAWLWHRGDDSDISVAGDRDVHGRLLGILGAPIT